jgi:phage terminase Nu1 subunit (DNA packaging protein)
MSGKVLTAAQLAKLCDVSKQTITNWMRAGMPHEGGGRQGSEVRISLEQVLPWLVRRHQAQSGSAAERLQIAQAIKVELQNGLKSGEVVLVTHIAAVFNELCADLAARLDALPGRLAGELAGITDADRIRQRLLEEHRSIRAGVAEHVEKFTQSLAAAADRAEDDSAPAAAEDAEPVGGRRKNPARRKRRTRKLQK